jgi:hypothetical protein
MAVDKEKIKELLGTGLSNEIVASAVGCDPSYISQLLSIPEFADSVAALRTASLMAASRQDKNLASIEERLTSQLSEMVESRQIYKPMDVVRTLVAINNTKRRGMPVTDTVASQQLVVNLAIPVKLVQNFVANSNGEVIEVDGKTLVTKPSSDLLRELSAREKEKQDEQGNGGQQGRIANKYDRVAAFLPNTALEVSKVGT